MTKVTTLKLANAFAKHFEDGAWGDIESHWFDLAAKLECGELTEDDMSSEDFRNATALLEIIYNVTKELNNE